MGEVVSTIPSEYLFSAAFNFLWSVFLFLVFKFVEWVLLEYYIIWSDCYYNFWFGAAIGFNVETVQYNNIKFQVWDLGMCIVSSLICVCNFMNLFKSKPYIIPTFTY